MGLVALVVMLVLGVFSAGPASAALFLWTGPLPALILVLNDNNQVFTAEETFAVTCRHFGAHGVTPSTGMSSGLVIITGTYSKCEATGNPGAVTITPVEYHILANGLVAISKPIVITIAGLGKCSLKLSPGGANSHLEKLRFLNQPEDLLVHAEVESITSTASGGICGTAGVEKPNGTYFGLFLVWVDGGTLKWHP